MAGDTLIGAVRRAIAGGEWHTAFAVEFTLGRLVPDGLALKTYERLARAGGAEARTRAERLGIGQARVVREKLQRLVTDGHAEAIGDGPSRAYRLKGCEVLKPRPKPERKFVPLERLTFDFRLQMRADLADLVNGVEVPVTYNAAWVKHLLAAAEDGAEFPPLEAVLETRGKRETYWVFAGFNRGEVYRRQARPSVEVLVYPGTFLDAKRWAAPSNATHGLNRTPADCRRAFDAVFADETLRAEVLAAAREKGLGVYRAFARACGIGHGIVGKYLERHGYRAVRKGTQADGGIEPIPASPPPPPADSPLSNQGGPPGPIALDPLAPADWRAAPVAELDLGGRVEDALRKCSVATVGDLADRLEDGDTFGLRLTDVLDLKEAVREHREKYEPCEYEPVQATAAETQAPPSPIVVPPSQSAETRAGQFAADRAVMDQVLRNLKAAAEGIDRLCGGPGGEFLRRVQVGGRPLVVKRPAPTKPGIVRPDVHRSPPLDALARACRACRVDHPCKGCDGHGCRACRLAGFVPADESLLKVQDGAAGFDFGDPWDAPQEG